MWIAAQLYIFSKQPDQAQRIDGVLSALAGAGYQAIEGMYRLPPQEPGVLARHGLRYVAPHLTPRELNPLDTATAFCRSMGATHICSSGLLEWNQRSPDDYRRSTAALNELGRRLRGEGIHLLYHNHEFEFEKVDGTKTGMDLLLANLDVDAVRLCLDLGWLWIAGADPVRFLREHGEKIGAVHLRDFKGKESVALGRGDIDLASVVAEVRKWPRLEVLAVEQDPTTPDPLGDMLTSRQFLAGLGV
jgi:sugar phosphate isomerase/epimerase